MVKKIQRSFNNQRMKRGKCHQYPFMKLQPSPEKLSVHATSAKLCETFCFFSSRVDSKLSNFHNFYKTLFSAPPPPLPPSPPLLAHKDGVSFIELVFLISLKYSRIKSQSVYFHPSVNKRKDFTNYNRIFRSKLLCFISFNKSSFMLFWLLLCIQPPGYHYKRM